MENEFLKALFDEYSKISDKIEKLTTERTEIGNLIVKRGGEIPQAKPSKQEIIEAFNTAFTYPTKGSWRDKITFVLRKSDVPLKSLEITSKLLDYETPINDKTIGQTLWSMKNAGLLKHEGKFYSLTNS